MGNLDLGLIGNCGISALIGSQGKIVWWCLPRYDGDPVFHQLLGSASGDPDDGAFSIELEGMKSSTQYYVDNTAILKTVLHGESGSIEITDFVPRFYSLNRPFRPQMLIRRLAIKAGRPRIRVKIRPRFGYGQFAPTLTSGSNHIRYVGPDMTLRLSSSDAPLDYIRQETFFNLRGPINLVLGPDETLSGSSTEIARNFEEQTTEYWRNWSMRLALQPEWQEAVIRAAITLKLCAYESTGGIVAAMTTSIPEAPGTGRNWDYRFCWVRDAYFVISALRSLAAGRTLENYYRWITNVVATSSGHIQPVYGIALEDTLTEHTATHLPGFASDGKPDGPVRVGNQAFEHFQHDTYGNLILASAQAFVDRRLSFRAGVEDFVRLEPAGEQAYKLHNQPDAGIWELRSRARVHTSSSVACWAACDRLAKIAAHLGLSGRAVFWRRRADEIKSSIVKHAWSEKRKAFVESFGGEHLDASVLLMGEMGFLDSSDPRFISTVEQIEKVLGRGAFMMRYEAADDFGTPETAFNVCAFWRLDCLTRTGRKKEAREMFQSLLGARNHLGLMSEDTHPVTGEAWGNFPQTYSMAGIINCAMRLSEPWESCV